MDVDWSRDTDPRPAGRPVAPPRMKSAQRSAIMITGLQAEFFFKHAPVFRIQLLSKSIR
jgi:hypothetical protein